MDREEVEDLLYGETVCRIAFSGIENPYIAPFQYAYLNGVLYFHFTNNGLKMKFLDQNPKVCVEIERLEPNLRDFRFVCLKGILKLVDDAEERIRAINQIREDGKRDLSPAFLAAHGINPKEGWNSLTAEKPFIIVKLSNITDVTGLKAPGHEGR